MGRTHGTQREIRNSYGILTQGREEERPFMETVRTWEDNNNRGTDKS
jgi:hypothetical protein